MVQERPEERWSPQGPVTVLFTDVEGSTALQAARGDTEARAVLAGCEELSRRQVAEHGGRVIKSTGDGLLIGFTSPRRAVACAMAIDRAMTEQNAKNPQRAVRVRAGLHAGEVLETADDLHGAAVHAAARICARAQGGEVLVSDVVRQLCGTVPGTAFWDYGRVPLRGFPEPWHLFRVMPSVDIQAAASGSTPFVGREDLRAELRKLLDRAAEGRGSLAMIGGEAGVGKTRLASEVAREAQQRGMGVYTGHCYEAGGDVPYVPWVEMLEGAARQLAPDVLLGVLGEHAPALAQMAPELRRMAPSIPPLVELPGEQQRRYLFNGVREWLARAAEARPRLLVFDDLHWADESTLLLVEHLVEWIDRMPLLALATYRDTPTDRSDAFAASLARLVRRPAVRLLSLARHSRAEVDEMLRALAGHLPPPEVSRTIYSESDGNAFFVEEVFRHLVEAGRLLDSQGRFRTDLQVGELEVPANVRLVIEQRLGRLSETNRRVLAAAAVLGRHFSFTILELVIEAKGEELLDAVEAAERAQILVEEPSDREPLYRFTHELFRQTLLNHLSAPRRQRIHLRAADALERAHAGEIDRHAGDVARHLVQAGAAADPARIAGALARAGDVRRAAASFSEALRDYEQAVAMLPAGSDRPRAELLVKIGLVQRSLRRWEEAIAKWDEALGILERLGEAEAVGALCFQLARELTWGYRFAEMVQVAYRGLAALGDRDTADAARLRLMTALALSLTGDSEQAGAQIAEARRFAEPRDDRHLLGEVWLAENVHHYFFMRLPETVETGRRAAGSLREVGDLWQHAEALGWLDVGLVFQGRFGESAEVHRELEPLAERLGHWGAASAAHRNAFAARSATEADLEALERITRTLTTIARDTGNPGWLGNACTLGGIVDFWRGKWPEARARFQEGLGLAMPFWFGPQHGALLVLQAWSGERDEALAHFDELRGFLPRPGQPNLLGAWNLAVLAAEAVGLLGDAERARVLYPLVTEALTTGAIMRQPDGRLIHTSAAVAAAAAGLDGAAEEHFERALRQSEELPHRLEWPHVRHLYAQYLLRRGGAGDGERARRLLEEACSRYRAIGMVRHEALAADLLRGPAS